MQTSPLNNTEEIYVAQLSCSAVNLPGSLLFLPRFLRSFTVPLVRSQFGGSEYHNRKIQSWISWQLERPLRWALDLSCLHFMIFYVNYALEKPPVM